MLMNLETLDWDDELLEAIGVPRAMLPEIRPRPRSTGRRAARWRACRSPPRSATSRRRCSARPASIPGEGKCTYGTGSFLLVNTGSGPVASSNGLLTTVGYQIGDAGRRLCAGRLDRGHRLAGAVAARQPRPDPARARRSRRWRAAWRTTAAATSCPAFSGLFAPHWRSDARGVIAGLTGYVTKGHIARAVLEAVAWQTREVVDAMDADSGAPLERSRPTAA